MAAGHNRNGRKRVLVAAAAAAMASTVGSAFAANFTWSGGGGNDNWSTGANWAGTAPAVDGTAALSFAGTTRLTPNNDLAGNTSFTGVTFNAGAGAFNLGGNALTLGGNVVNRSSNH